MALKSVLLDELRDMYSAENQLVKALPKLAKGAKNPKLKKLFSTHLAETKRQVERLKQVFVLLEEKPTGQHCNGMEGVIEEGKMPLKRTKKARPLIPALLAQRCGLSIMRLQAMKPVSQWRVPSLFGIDFTRRLRALDATVLEWVCCASTQVF